MNYRFLPKAKNDLNDAVDYYENCRRCLTNRFPYEIIYTIQNDVILILAVANRHRHPDFWKHRQLCHSQNR